MKTNILALVITLTVGIVLAGSLLMPVVEDMSETTSTFTNTGSFYLSSEEPLNMTWDGTTLQVNDQELTLPSTNTAIALWGPLQKINANTNGLTLEDSLNNVWAQLTALDLTFENGAASATYSKSNQTGLTYTSEITGVGLMMVPDNGDYVAKASGATVYVKLDSAIQENSVRQVSGTGITSFNVGLGLYGNLEDGLTGTVAKQGLTVGEIEPVYAAVAGYDDLYTITNVSVPWTWVDPNDSSKTASGSWIVADYTVPTTITVDKPGAMDAASISIMQALPILVIVALLLGAVGLVVRNRD